MAARGLVNGRGPSLRRCSGRWEFTHVFQSVLLGMGGIAPKARSSGDYTPEILILLLLVGLELSDVFCRADAVVLLKGCGEVGLGGETYAVGNL